MSAGGRIHRAVARRLLDRVLGVLGAQDVTVAGSIRRGRMVVGDADLLAPLPAPGREREDRLCQAILTWFTWRGKPGGLFSPRLPESGHGSMGWIERGCTPGFRFACLVVVDRAADGSVLEMPIQIQRYAPGPLGNFGYQLLLRTGPAEFGMMLLERYRRRRDGTAAGGPRAADGGYLLDARGSAVPTPTEECVFALAGMDYVPPERRDGSLSSSGAGAA